MSKKYYFSIWIITLSLLIIFTLPVLIQDGMFMDAVQYAAVAHNLSEGIGSFWNLQFDAHNIHDLSSFSEQPPLAFAIQALFFKMFGGSMYVERAYTFLCLLITFFLIICIWRYLFKKERSYRQFSWLAVILWITVPIVFWSFQNDMLENTMGVFILLSALCILKSFDSERGIILSVAGGIFIFLASLTKGLPGIFTLAMPVLYSLTTRNISVRKAFYSTLLLLTTLAIPYFILIIFPASNENLSRYFFQRVMVRIQNYPTVSDRIFIAKSLIMQTTLQILFVLIILFANKIKWRVKTINHLNRLAIFFLLIGFSGSLPLLLTKVQRTFYLTPSLPFFAFGFASLILPVIDYFINILKVRPRLINIVFYFSILLFCTSIFLTTRNFGRTSRDKEFLTDVHTLGQILPQYTYITAPTVLYYDWRLQSYLIRYYNITLDYDKQYDYVLLDKQSGSTVDSTFKKFNSGLKKYKLYKKINK